MRRSPLASVITSALLVIAGVGGASSAAAHGTLVGSTPAASTHASTVTTSPATVAGPSSPTTHEPGDNEPALVIGGFAALAALVAAGWFVARRRVHDDPR